MKDGVGVSALEEELRVKEKVVNGIYLCHGSSNAGSKPTLGKVCACHDLLRSLLARPHLAHSLWI